MRDVDFLEVDEGVKSFEPSEAVGLNG
jgi:hypothetical protein